MRLAVPFASFALTTLPLHAEDRQPCLNLVESHAQVTLSGELRIKIFATLPDFGGPAQIDAEEPALLLKLPKRLCANDGMFINDVTDFDTVDVRSELPRIAKVLNASIGHQITVRGEAFGAYNEQHKAPLVLYVDQVSRHHHVLPLRNKLF